MKTILVSIFLSLHLMCFSQDSLNNFKNELSDGLLKFQNSVAGEENFNYINVAIFEKLLDCIDNDMGKKMFNLEPNHIFSITISTDKLDTIVKYCYYHQLNDHFEHYYKNSYPSCNQDTKQYVNNLISSEFTGVVDLLAIDTIANVIITKPIKSSYELYRSICPGGLSKTEAIKRFKEQIFGQYQLKIWMTPKKSIVYFIAPPAPDSDLKFKHKRTHF